MEVKASWRLAARPAKIAGPALAAFLVTGAGVAAIAQPIAARPELVPALPPLVSPHVQVAVPAIRPATIRIVLPPPVVLVPRVRGLPSESQGFASNRLDSITPEFGAAGTPPARLAMAPPAPIAAPGATALAPEGAPQPAPRTMSARPEKAIAMVNAESPAALARMGGDDDAMAPSGTIRPDALRPAAVPARALVDVAPARAAAPSRMSPIRMQGDDGDGISRYRQTSQGLAFDVAATVNGAAIGKVALLIRDEENISVRLADLLAAVEPRIAPAAFQKLSASQAAQSYVTFNELREAGIAVRFDDDDRLILGVK